VAVTGLQGQEESRTTRSLRTTDVNVARQRRDELIDQLIERGTPVVLRSRITSDVGGKTAFEPHHRLRRCFAQAKHSSCLSGETVLRDIDTGDWSEIFD
jgi:hypothetical protein